MKVKINSGTEFSPSLFFQRRRIYRGILMLIWGVLGVATLAYSVKSFAATAEEVRAQIKNKMAERHPSDSANFWTSLGPDAVPVIEQMYTETQSVFQKSWLLDGLAHFQDSSIGTLLETQIQSDSSNEVLKRKMLGSLVESQGDAAAAFVEPYLKDSDAQTRLAVAQALKKYTNSEETRKKLAEFEANEKLAWVRASFLKVEDAPTGLLKRNGNIYSGTSTTGISSGQSGNQSFPLPTPLPEKAWAGEWKGVYLTPKKTSVANLTLKLLKENATAVEQKWKILLKLPKQTAFEIREKNVEIVYYQTGQAHWLELRSKRDQKDDSVFIAQRTMGQKK